jgi:hypothetical protein
LTENHELDMNVLRQTNEELQEHIIRVERERQLFDEKTVIESIQLKAQAEREKNSMIKSHEMPFVQILLKRKNKSRNWGRRWWRNRNGIKGLVRHTKII